ncbi:lectin like domain-containing protein [uncultured Methanobrevibacter sp.]|uniref:lectin like domain-containing protein n=1 Tax=uncultured Methanobrevibacter sp. TaxID=253161 RepID=UPI0025E4E259|nr:lectin like domain-containing protein [uncultured Methanobrevibacter sp.]
MVGNSFESVGYNCETAWLANQFTAESNNPLKAFGLYTFGSSSYLVNVTVNGISKLVQEGALIGAGYHTVKLNSMVDLSKGDIFKIIVKLTTPGSLFPIAIESKRSDYSDKVSAQANQSFISPNGVNWIDTSKNTAVIKLYENLMRINLVETNVCLKAYTDFADDLALDLKSNASYYIEEDLIEFNLTISNNGDFSKEVNVSSIFDDSIDVIYSYVTKGFFDETSKIWTMDSLDNGETQTLNLILRFNEDKSSMNLSFIANSLTYSFNKNMMASSVVNYVSFTEFLKIADVTTNFKSNKIVSIGLLDAYKKLIPNRNISISLKSSNNNYSMNPITLNTNDAYAKFTLNLLPGKCVFMALFDGEDGRYDPSNTTFTVTVVKNSTQVIANNLTTYSVVVSVDGKSGKNLTMTLKDKNGKALAGKKVTFTVKNTTYTRTTDKSGVARLQINIAAAGTYTFKISFAGDANYTGSSKTVKVIVKKQSLRLTAPNRTYRVGNKNKYLTATLKNSKGKAIKNKKITFTINGKRYVATTNSKGLAKVKVSLSSKKTYKFTAKFAGDKSYNAISRTAKVVVKR